jgi:large subunit ribosomal protein L4
MQVDVKNMAGETVEQIELAPAIFEAPINVGLMHQALQRQLANARQGTHDTQTRAEVSRSGAKVWRQKGTGRARQGSRRAPHWRGGGVVFGPHPRSYRQAMPRRMRHAALRSALSAKAAEAGGIIVLDALSIEQPRTREMAVLLDRVAGPGSLLVLLAARDEAVERSIRNLPDVTYLRASYLNVRDLLGHDRVLIPRDALAVIEHLLGATARTRATALAAAASEAAGEERSTGA